MSRAGTRILVLEDDATLAEALCDQLVDCGFDTTHAPDVAAAGRLLSEQDFDVALLDLHLPDGTGLDVLATIVDQGLMTESVVLTGYAEVSTAIRAIKLGAYDYLSKPARGEELELVVGQAADKARLRRENQSLQVRLGLREPRVEGLVTDDPAMKQLLETLERAAHSELPILVQGESGTGKELVAQAVHQRSARSNQAFVAINCGALPEGLMESELFGHEKGAFTGAQNRKPGLFEVADRGTLFLDEIGELPLAVQVKLLRAIELGEFLRVGSTRAMRADVRVVAATNRDLLAEVDAGRFRQDLFFRLDGVTLSLPPLRDRPGDIAPLAAHFLREAGTKKLLSPGASRALLDYNWPGNVRELQMVIRRAAILSRGDRIGPGDLTLSRRQSSSPRETLPSGLTLAELQDVYIRKVLDDNDGHRGRTAKALGIDAKTLYNRLGPEQRKGPATVP